MPKAPRVNIKPDEEINVDEYQQADIQSKFEMLLGKYGEEVMRCLIYVQAVDAHGIHYVSHTELARELGLTTRGLQYRLARWRASGLLAEVTRLYYGPRIQETVSTSLMLAARWGEILRGVYEMATKAERPSDRMRAVEWLYENVIKDVLKQESPLPAIEVKYAEGEGDFDPMALPGLAGKSVEEAAASVIGEEYFPVDELLEDDVYIVEEE